LAGALACADWAAAQQPAFEEGSIKHLPATPDAKPAPPLSDLPEGPQDFAIETPRPEKQLIVSVSDFGADPASEDNYDAFVRAIQHCRQENASLLKIPQGVYFFDSNHPALALSGLSDFTLDGGNAELVWRNPPGPRYGGMFALTDCERVCLMDFILDWDWSVDPLASLVEVIAVHPEGDFIDIKFLEHEHFPNRQTLIRVLEAVDPDTLTVGAEGKRDIYVDWSLPVPPGQITLEWLSGNTARLHAFDTARRNNFRRNAAVGDLFRARHYSYAPAAITLRRSRHVTLSGIRIHACPGMGIVGRDRPQYVQIRNCQVVRRPEAKRMISCTADHVNFGDTLGYLLMEDCDLGWGGDDCINVHNGCAPAEKVDEFRVTARLFDHMYRVGDLVEFRRRDLSPLGFSTCVRSLQNAYTDAGTRTIVEFHDELPEFIPRELVLYNRTIQSGNVIIRNCYLHENRARGVLVEAPNCLIENCRFFRIQMAALLFNSGYTEVHWNEGQEVTNVVVRNSVFEDCNKARMGEKGPQVFMTVYLGRPDTPERKTNYPVFRDILFDSNTFADCPSSSFFLSSARNIIVQNNVFRDPNSRKINPPERAMMYISYASDIHILNNRWVRSPYVTSPGAIVDTASTEGIHWQGNTVTEP